MGDNWIRGRNHHYDCPFELALEANGNNIAPIKLERSSAWKRGSGRTEAWLIVPYDTVSPTKSRYSAFDGVRPRQSYRNIG
jgi:hypothetical protein